ncbi:MAG: molybdate ABC transporter substrate-binding protein [Anaerolineae bacterium]
MSAAISLADPVAELSDLFERENPGVEVVLNLAGSGALAAQIAQGAGVDVFLSAGPRPMDLLESEVRLVPGTRRDLVSNELALVGGSSAPDLRFSSLPTWSGELALGDPNVVPAGTYAVEVLSAVGAWPWPSDRLVMGESVRQALTFVETGQVGLGIVYRTDALASDTVTLLDIAPPGSHSPIRYPGAAIAGTREPELARAFLELVGGPDGVRILFSHGFLRPDEDPA